MDDVTQLSLTSLFGQQLKKDPLKLEKRAKSKKGDKKGGFYISLNSAMLSAMTMIPAITPNIDEWALP